MTNPTLRCPAGHVVTGNYEFIFEYMHIPANILDKQIVLCMECKLPYFDYQCTEEKEND